MRIEILNKNVKTLAVMFYDEQLCIKPEELYSRVTNLPLDNAEVAVIEHDKEKKKHYHLGVRLMGKDKKNGKHIKTLLNYFGICFRNPEDNSLIARAIDTINDYQSYLLYLLHMTANAKLKGKKQYNIGDIVTNIPPDTMQMYLEGDVGKNVSIQKILEELDRMAYELGYNFNDIDEILAAQPLDIRSKTSKIKAIKETYQRGIDKRIQEDNTIIRTCIFIQGAKDMGKTYSSSIALQKMGYQNILRPSGGKTGMFDELKATTDAIIIDDDKLDNALNICDNKICRVYRRNSNNPVFTGDMVIITSNYSYDDWASRCGYSGREIEAIRSRLYVTYVHNSQLICTSPSKRGTEEEQMIRKEKYLEFKRYFTESIESYHNIGKIDYSDINN